MHTNFKIDSVDYLCESACSEQVWPRLIDKIVRHLERIGKRAAKDMYGHTATASGYTRINGKLVDFNLTINPQGLKCY